MRFVLFFLFFALWSGLWWWHYTCHIKLACCPESFITAGSEETIDLEGRTLVFKWSDPMPLRGSEFPGLVDSLYSELNAGDTLVITGFYFRDEIPSKSDLNIGKARAEAVAEFFPKLNEQGRIITGGKAVPLRGDFRDRLFEGIGFEVRRFIQKTPEMEERATLYFPFNSTRRIEDSEHAEYLDNLSEYLKKTGYRVVLTGHTDDMGTNESNYYLGLWRAAALRDYLVSKGVDDRLIEVKSKGEIDPVASNATYVGKRKNRRVEIQILKEN